MIASMCQPGKIKSLPALGEEETKKFVNSVCMAASICLRQCNQLLSATHYRISLLLLNGGAKALTIERCSLLGISVSHSAAIRMQTKASTPGSTKATTWREDSTSKSLQVRFLEGVLQTQDSDDINLSHDTVKDYSCFHESVFSECCSVLEKVTGSQGNVTFKRESLRSAIQEIKKSIVHYK